MNLNKKNQMYPYVFQHRLNEDIITIIKSFIPSRKTINTYLQEHLQYFNDVKILTSEIQLSKPIWLMVEYDKNDSYWHRLDINQLKIEVDIKWYPPNYFKEQQMIEYENKEVFFYPIQGLQPRFWKKYIDRLEKFTKHGRRIYTNEELDFCENKKELNEWRVKQYKELYGDWLNEKEISTCIIDDWFINEKTGEIGVNYNYDCVILGDGWYGWYVLTPIKKIEIQF